MGYSADTEDRDGPIHLNKSDMAAIVTELYKAEAVLGDHISWCDPIAKVIARCDGDMSAVVADIMQSYGFVIEEKSGDVILKDWGGDKIGSCWTEVWNAIGSVSTDEITWVMRGEDNEMWAATVGNGTCLHRPVEMTWKIVGTENVENLV